MAVFSVQLAINISIAQNTVNDQSLLISRASNYATTQRPGFGASFYGVDWAGKDWSGQDLSQEAEYVCLRRYPPAPN
jgi:hypothetical protein